MRLLLSLFALFLIICCCSADPIPQTLPIVVGQPLDPVEHPIALSKDELNKEAVKREANPVADPHRGGWGGWGHHGGGGWGHYGGGGWGHHGYHRGYYGHHRGGWGGYHHWGR